MKREILDVLDKTVNEDNVIIEKGNPNQKVLTFDGEELTLEEFGGIQKGSEVFIKNDLISLMRLSKK
ncbi:hypothetical protein HZC30_06835 [Candidatus Woesearchaeota archaeon]|nr:hypothetical protein [Candidatus Woesearchaeota archaeon]